MGWTPADIQSSTLKEILWCFRGWQRANGMDPDEKPLAPMSRAEMKKLMEQFPDGR